MKLMKLNFFQKRLLKKLIAEVESRHFRTEHDTGATENALMIINTFRTYAGMSRIRKTDLPRVCPKHKKYDMCHKKD